MFCCYINSTYFNGILLFIEFLSLSPIFFCVFVYAPWSHVNDVYFYEYTTTRINSIKRFISKFNRLMQTRKSHAKKVERT